jgi:intracellular septation protein A
MAIILMSIAFCFFCGLGTIIYVLYNWENRIWTSALRFGGLGFGIIIILVGIWLISFTRRRNSKK